MKKALAAVCVFILLCAGVGYWTLRGFSKTLQSEIVAAVAGKTGRTLTLGKTAARFSLTPSVTLQNVRLADAADWAGEANMLEIGSLTLRAELWPLFSKRVEVRDVVVDGVRLNLKTDGERNNWTFGTKTDGENIPAADDAPLAAKPEKTANSSGFDWKNGKLTVKDVAASLTDFKTGRRIETSVAGLTASRDEKGVFLASDLTIGDESFSVSMTVRDETAAAPRFSIGLNNAGLAFKAAGTFDKASESVQADIRAVITDLAVLKAFTGKNWPSLKNTTVTAQVAGTVRNVTVPAFEIVSNTPDALALKLNGEVRSFKPVDWRVKADVDAPAAGKIDGLPAFPAAKAQFDIEKSDKFALNIAALEIGSSALSGKVAARENAFAAEVNAKRINLAELALIRPATLKKDPAPAVRTGGAQGKRAGGDVFSPEPLPFEKLRAADIRVKINVGDLTGADGSKLGRAALSAVMQNGRFVLSDVSLGGRAVVRANFDAAGNAAAARVAARFDQMPLGWFFANARQGVLSGEIALAGRGGSEREIASSLDGRVFLNARGLQTRSSLPPFLASLLSLPSDDKRPPLNISCAVVNVPVKKGIASSENKIALESDAFDLRANGKINLGAEKVDMKVEVSPKSGALLTKIMNGVVVKGRLGRPDFRVDGGQAFDRVMALGMAFLGGGRQGVEDFARQKTLENVCVTAMAGAK